MRLRFSPLLALGALLGCVENVPIAAECPPDRSAPCFVELDGGEVDAPPTVLPPVARADAGTRDGATISAEAGTSPATMPPLENLSFEFSSANSVAGDVTTVSNLTTITAIAPWYTCQPIGGQTGNSVTAVRAETGLPAGTKEGEPKVAVAPSDGETFITVGYLVNIVPMPLLQHLATPLRDGQRYAFAIDALATSTTAMLSLQLRANTQGCLGASSQQKLFTSEPISAQTWSTVCVSFTSPAELDYLILAAEPSAGSTIDPAEMLIEGDILGGPRLMFDRIRAATPAECPNL